MQSFAEVDDAIGSLKGHPKMKSQRVLASLVRSNRVLACRSAPAPHANMVAIFSLFVAILSTSFAIYQWWSSGKGERIRAAIEVSNRYISEAVDPYLLLRQ